MSFSIKAMCKHGELSIAGRPPKPRSRRLGRCREPAATTFTSPRPKDKTTTHLSSQTCLVRPPPGARPRKLAHPISGFRFRVLRDRAPRPCPQTGTNCDLIDYHLTMADDIPPRRLCTKARIQFQHQSLLLKRCLMLSRGAASRVGDAIEKGRKPGMPLSILTNIGGSGIFGCLLVAFLLGVAVAQRH